VKTSIGLPGAGITADRRAGPAFAHSPQKHSGEMAPMWPHRLKRPHDVHLIPSQSADSFLSSCRPEDYCGGGAEFADGADSQALFSIRPGRSARMGSSPLRPRSNTSYSAPGLPAARPGE